ncbi:hypothetical protein IWZ00DRAFT_380228 [Phyllosticta capitalensis]
MINRSILSCLTALLTISVAAVGRQVCEQTRSFRIGKGMVPVGIQAPCTTYERRRPERTQTTVESLLRVVGGSTRRRENRPLPRPFAAALRCRDRERVRERESARREGLCNAGSHQFNHRASRLWLLRLDRALLLLLLSALVGVIASPPPLSSMPIESTYLSVCVAYRLRDAALPGYLSTIHLIQEPEDGENGVALVYAMSCSCGGKGRDGAQAGVDDTASKRGSSRKGQRERKKKKKKRRNPLTGNLLTDCCWLHVS